ncbi:MAG: PIG-L family deacetylase [Anaerolineaceae bacterium]|nr:PIG-L family deacetylase [Anaerolineaceae bacterium]
MESPLSLMCVVAHPDDESLGIGFTLAKYAAEGVYTSVVMATRGERGWKGKPTDYPGPEALGRIREAELLTSAKILGVNEIKFLDYMDGEVDRVEPLEISGKIAQHIRRLRPQVLITFDPLGAYGPTDHIAISQFALGAIALAASCEFSDPGGNPPHQVAKVYYMIDSEPLVKLYTRLTGKRIHVTADGERRKYTGWPVWAASARVDATGYWDVAVEALASHESQVGHMMALIRRIPARFNISSWAVQTFYRVYSLVNSGRQVEMDLFEGLR